MRGIPFARPNNQKAPAAPPCHSPVLGGSAFEKSAAAGQIEFFLWFILRKKCRIPALSYIHSCSSIMIRWNRVHDPGPCPLRVAVAMSDVLTEASVVETDGKAIQESVPVDGHVSGNIFLD
jgi:hypothetical protein